jgi:phage-related protein
MAATFDPAWCPAPEVSRERSQRLTEITYGDGYTHRLVIGRNPLNDIWNVTFNGDETLLDAIDLFLVSNSVAGFYWTPPAHVQIFVTCDSWTLTWRDRARGGGQLLGSISATFRRNYNLQPDT